MRATDLFILSTAVFTALFAFLQYKTIDKNLSEVNEAVQDVKSKVDNFL